MFVKKLLSICLSFLCMFASGSFFVKSACAQNKELVISAAASLTNAFGELATLFEKEHPDIKIRLNFAASNPLLRQIVEGAPADVFATADQATMDKAEKANLLVPNTRQNFAANQVALIVPKGQKKITNPEQLTGLQKIAVGKPESVPAGRYAKESLEKLKLWEKLQPKFIYGESVRQTLDYVGRGEVDAGIVYLTDAKQMKNNVDVSLIMEGHTPVTYPVATVNTGANKEGAQLFIKFLQSKQAQDILDKYGFSKP